MSSSSGTRCGRPWAMKPGKVRSFLSNAGEMWVTSREMMGVGRSFKDPSASTKFSSARFFVRPKRLVQILKNFLTPVVLLASLQRMVTRLKFCHFSADLFEGYYGSDWRALVCLTPMSRSGMLLPVFGPLHPLCGVLSLLARMILWVSWPLVRTTLSWRWFASRPRCGDPLLLVRMILCSLLVRTTPPGRSMRGGPSGAILAVSVTSAASRTVSRAFELQPLRLQVRAGKSLPCMRSLSLTLHCLFPVSLIHLV